MANNWKLNERVSLDAKGNGTIAFIGETQFATGIWYGVILDQPNGKNNGTVKDVKYFDCEANHGIFVKENQVSDGSAAWCRGLGIRFLSVPACADRISFCVD